MRVTKLTSILAVIPTIAAAIMLLVVSSNHSQSTRHNAADIIKASDPSNLKLAFVTNNASEFWKIAAAGVHKFEKEKNIQVEIKLPTQGKTEEQNTILENLTSQGYNGIAVSVIQPKDQVQALNRVAKTTNLITFDSDCAKSKRILYIGTNNFEAGKSLGAEILKLLPNGGKMAVFCGSFTADNAAQRLGGIEEAIKGHNIDIVAKKEDGTDRAKARSNVEDVINAFPDLNLVCGLWSYNGPAIAAAVKGSDKKGKLLAAVFDEEQGTLDGIKAGYIQCTCVQKPFMFGYLSAQWMYDLATQGDAVKLPEGNVVDTGVNIVTDEKSPLADPEHGTLGVIEFEQKLADMKAGK